MAMNHNDADKAIGMLKSCGFNADKTDETGNLTNVTASKDNFYRTFWSLGEVKQFCRGQEACGGGSDSSSSGSSSGEGTRANYTTHNFLNNWGFN